MVLRSMVTIAGGAAVWGMLLMSMHLFCQPPLEMQPAMKIRPLRSPARVRLQQVWFGVPSHKLTE